VFQGVTGTSTERDDSSGGAGPVKADVRTTALKMAGDRRSASLGKQDTTPFSMLGVTWTDPAATVRGDVEVRTRSTASGRWSGWLGLETGIDSRAETGHSGIRGATEPRWVGPSDGVEVRISAADAASTKLPEGLRLDLVDPGRGTVTNAKPAAYAAGVASTSPAPTDSTTADPSAPSTVVPAPPDTGTAAPSAPETASAPPASGGPAPSTAPSDSASPAASPSATVSTPTAPPSSVPRPPVTSRAEWGADESMSPEPPEYLDGIKAVFVHHTAEAGNYACTDSPAIVRGLYAYHVQSNGWKDIGYNFVVDKCGTVFEGRKGGVDLPVFGAHTYGFNRESAGIAVIGTYTDAPASAAAVTSVARIAAWKLGQYGAAPDGTVALTAGATGGSYAGKAFTAGTAYTFDRVSGHRDGFNTLCPGTKLYGQLPTIRSYAAGPVTGLAITSVTGGGKSGTTYYTKAGITVSWSAATPSALVSAYELLVDGKTVATAAGSATSAKATLALGTHKVQVRATHQSGRTATSAAATVVAETTRPVFTTPPNLTLRTGTVNTTAVPLTLRWKATGTAALKEVRLTVPLTRTYGPTTTSASHTAKSGVATRWSMTAYDQAGNAGYAAVYGTPVILQESSAIRSGSWTTKSSSSYLGGKSFSSSSKSASLTWTFTGRSASWVVSRASTSGQAYIYVDGTKVATVDLKSSTTAYRNAIWTKSWTSSAKHTVKIVVVGTSGRPTVTTDGLVYLK
jgi:uncharacterized protein with LGFP repeats